MTTSITEEPTDLSSFPLRREDRNVNPKPLFPGFLAKYALLKKNFKLPKIFCIKFSAKIVLMKMFVAIVLTKLQRSESGANVSYAGGPKISTPKRTPEARTVKTDVILEVSVELH